MYKQGDQTITTFSIRSMFHVVLRKVELVCRGLNDIIKSQYHGDVVVPVLRTVTVKGEYGSYIAKTLKDCIMSL